MGLLDREERKTLRSIQGHLNQTLRESDTVVEQVGTVDVYFHPTNPDPYLNCATPHKGVAWVRRDDLISAFKGLERLGRVPRLVFQDALFPEAFVQQIKMMGLTLEDERIVMVYRPILGPGLPEEIPLGRLPDEMPRPVTTDMPTQRAELATWLRVFRAGYYNTELLTVQPEAIDPLLADLKAETRYFVQGYYERTPLGAARISVRPPTAELEAVVTAPFWHGMGLEVGLTMTAVREAEARGCTMIFTTAPPGAIQAIYRRLGFLDLTRVLTFWQAEQYASPVKQTKASQSSDKQSGDDDSQMEVANADESVAVQSPAGDTTADPSLAESSDSLPDTTTREGDNVLL